MRKGQVDKALPEPKKDVKFEIGSNKEYKVGEIINSMVYA